MIHIIFNSYSCVYVGYANTVLKMFDIECATLANTVENLAVVLLRLS